MRRRLELFAVLILISISGLGAQTRKPPGNTSPTFGRAWFMNASDREVRGFITGYYDCLPNPALRKLPGWAISDESMVKKVGAFYKRHKASRLDVAHVALRIAANTRPMPPPPGGEVYKSRHGFLDGLWWKGAMWGDQPGYVEGYLVCLGRPADNLAADKVVKAITAWYRQHPSREDRAIAYVLQDVLRNKNHHHRPKNSRH